MKGWRGGADDLNEWVCEYCGYTDNLNEWEMRVLRMHGCTLEGLPQLSCRKPLVELLHRTAALLACSIKQANIYADRAAIPYTGALRVAKSHGNII